MSPRLVASLTFCAMAAGTLPTASASANSQRDMLMLHRTVSKGVGIVGPGSHGRALGRGPAKSRVSLQLALQALVAAAGAGALERAQRKPHEHVAQILVRHRIAGVVAQRGFEQLTRGIDAALRGQQHRQVVVRLGQVGEILDQLVERVDRLGRALQLGQHHRTQKAHRRIARPLGDGFVGALHRHRGVAAAKQLLHIAEVLRGLRPQGRGRGQRERGETAVAPGGDTGCKRGDRSVVRRYTEFIVSSPGARLHMGL